MSADPLFCLLKGRWRGLPEGPRGSVIYCPARVASMGRFLMPTVAAETGPERVIFFCQRSSRRANTHRLLAGEVKYLKAKRIAGPSQPRDSALVTSNLYATKKIAWISYGRRPNTSLLLPTSPVISVSSRDGNAGKGASNRVVTDNSLKNRKVGRGGNGLLCTFLFALVISVCRCQKFYSATGCFSLRDRLGAGLKRRAPKPTGTPGKRRAFRASDRFTDGAI